VEQLVAAYRTARRLGAKPLANQLAGALNALGERPVRRLGRRTAAQLENGGLTRREVEIVRMVATGRTDREIARELFLSPAYGRDARQQHPDEVERPLSCGRGAAGQ
jgi:DNA-binding NarL/FixJ family response regulator